jgi:hypothetical protein
LSVASASAGAGGDARIRGFFAHSDRRRGFRRGASEHSLIELDLDAESSKDFEQFLINRGIEFKIQDKGGRMAYLIYSEPTDVLVRMNPGDAATHHGG